MNVHGLPGFPPCETKWSIRVQPSHLPRSASLSAIRTSNHFNQGADHGERCGSRDIGMRDRGGIHARHARVALIA